jgi:hypothetical protein
LATRRWRPASTGYRIRKSERRPLGRRSICVGHAGGHSPSRRRTLILMRHCRRQWARTKEEKDRCRRRSGATPGRKAPFLSSARVASLRRPSFLRETPHEGDRRIPRGSAPSRGLAEGLTKRLANYGSNAQMRAVESTPMPTPAAKKSRERPRPDNRAPTRTGMAGMSCTNTNSPL